MMAAYRCSSSRSHLCLPGERAVTLLCCIRRSGSGFAKVLWIKTRTEPDASQLLLGRSPDGAIPTQKALWGWVLLSGRRGSVPDSMTQILVRTTRHQEEHRGARGWIRGGRDQTLYNDKVTELLLDGVFGTTTSMRTPKPSTSIGSISCSISPQSARVRTTRRHFDRFE